MPQRTTQNEPYKNGGKSHEEAPFVGTDQFPEQPTHFDNVTRDKEESTLSSGARPPVDYDAWTLQALRQEARKLGLRGVQRLDRKQLIKQLSTYDGQSAP